MKQLLVILMLLVCCVAGVSCSGKGQQAVVQPDSQPTVHTTQTELNLDPVSLPDPQMTYTKHIVVLNPQEPSQTRDVLIAGLTKPASHLYNTVFVGFAADISQSELQSLTADGRVAYVEEEVLIQHCAPLLENNPGPDPWGSVDNLVPTTVAAPVDGPIRFEGDNPVDWGVSRINAFPSPGLKGAGITVAIIDTGIDTDHPDLAGSLVAEYDAVNNIEGAGTAEDLHGHGTHVAGIVGARDNDIGTVGVAPECSFVAIKVFPGASGGGSDLDLIRGIDWMAANHDVVNPPIKVANMSLSGTGTSRAMYDAIQACNDLGITTVVAAGNDFRDASQQLPARFDNVITVSAMKRVWNAGAYDYKFATFSNWGNVVDLIAPGQSILSLRNDGTTRYMSGTSMACPHVAGMAALHLDHNATDDFTDVRSALVADGEGGTWVGDPDGVYEPLVYFRYETWQRDGWWMFGCNAQHTRQSKVKGAQSSVVNWAFPTGGIVYSSPAIGVDGVVYIGSTDHNFYAINPDGTMAWSYTTNLEIQSSPAIGLDGTVYVGSEGLYAFNADGTLQWLFNTGGTVWSSPAIGEDGTIYVGSGDYKLYAVNPDGSEKWSFPTGDWVASSPAIGLDGTIYFGSYDHNLYAVNPDGSMKWEYTTGNQVYSSPAIGADGTVYVGSDGLYAINPDGSLKWISAGGGGSRSPGISADGTIHIGSLAINPDGSTKWQSSSAAFAAPAIGNDGKVYIGTGSDQIIAVNPDGTNNWTYSTGGTVRSSPAIGADGTLFVGCTDGFLYAFGVVPAYWNTLAADSTANTGAYTSLTKVEGYPAISYYNVTNGDLMFVRGTYANGSAWDAPVAIDTLERVGLYTSLAIVDGNPAISYFDSTNADLKFVRATSTSGSTWGTPLTLDSGLYTSLAVVDGNPAIGYYDGTLKYIRATDANGSTWGGPVTVDSTGDVGKWASLAVVNGNPAIGYYDSTNGDLKYVRATDIIGNTWDTPAAIDTLGFVGQYSSLAVVNGNPAISYYDSSNDDLKYVRATDNNGNTWDTPLAIDTVGNVGEHTSLAVINGSPAISYYDQLNENLKFIWATDSNGSSWETPLAIDSNGNVGWYTSLAVINGNPGIAYFDVSNNDLKFAYLGL